MTGIQCHSLQRFEEGLNNSLLLVIPAAFNSRKAGQVGTKRLAFQQLKVIGSPLPRG